MPPVVLASRLVPWRSLHRVARFNREVKPRLEAFVNTSILLYFHRLKLVTTPKTNARPAALALTEPYLLEMSLQKLYHHYKMFIKSSFQFHFSFQHRFHVSKFYSPQASTPIFWFGLARHLQLQDNSQSSCWIEEDICIMNTKVNTLPIFQIQLTALTQIHSLKCSSHKSWIGREKGL